jgi:hypothetical protein
MKPEKRRVGLLLTQLEDELLVYDLERHRAHCLNRAAAVVFERCDGKTSVRGLARALHEAGQGPAEEALVWLALERLDKAHLLQTPLRDAREASRLSRRELVRRAAVLAGLLLPAVTSVVAPTPAEAAATCTNNCAGKPFGTPCSLSAPSNCLCTCDGAGTCVGGCA